MHATPKVHTASLTLRIALALSALGMASTSFAGRPLSVEDAGVNPLGQCQLESWVDQTSQELGLVLAPACGVVEGLELGIEFDIPRHKSKRDAGRAVALKWAPVDFAGPNWSFGAKLAISQVKLAGESSWRSGATSLQGIASYNVATNWTAHVNLGVDMVRNPSEALGTVGAAAVWTPHKNWLFFAEVSGAEKDTATRTMGTRFWLMPDELGLDLTAGRANGRHEPTAYTLGVSWYGIKF